MKYEKKLELLRNASGVRPVQFAALCLRRKAGRAEVLMITSRETGRWLLPKGWRMDDRSEGETALTEAWEEAGVIGRLSGPALGTYGAQKALETGRPCDPGFEAGRRALLLANAAYESMASGRIVRVAD